MKKWLKIIVGGLVLWLIIILLSGVFVIGLSGDGGANSAQAIDSARSFIDEIKPISLLFRLALYSVIVLKGYTYLLPKRKDSEGNRLAPDDGDVTQSKLLMVVICLAHEIIVVQRLFLV